MTKVEMFIQTNGSNKEKKKLHIKPGAIDDFTRAGFETNEFESTVIYGCGARAIGPEEIMIVISLLDNILQLLSICKSIYRFIKRTKGYYIDVIVEDTNNIVINNNTTINNNITINNDSIKIYFKDDETEDECIERIKKELKL